MGRKMQESRAPLLHCGLPVGTRPRGTRPTAAHAWHSPAHACTPGPETEGTEKGIEICRSDNEPVNDINDTSRTSLNHPGPTI